MATESGKELFINAIGFQCLEHLQNDSVDLYLSTCGVQNCAPGHWYGPGKRDEYLIHFICEGKGIYRAGGQTYHLKKGDFFVIFPGTEIFYEADHKEPWDYIWVGFQGIKSETYLKYAGLDSSHLTGQYLNSSFVLSCVQQMILARSISTYNELKRTSALLQILAALMEEYSSTNQEDGEKDYAQKLYIDKALAYIDDHISQNIKINDIASFIGIDRSYLTNIFKQTLSLSPQEYLMHYRINQACIMLKNPELKISSIAKAVGYDDPLSFSKMFKKCKGISPSEFRLNQRL